MSRSETLFNEAQKYIPGGVNSPVRAFSGVGGTPVYFKQAKGAYLTDEDDKSYVDYVGSWGPMILGHSHPKVIAAVVAQAELGLSFGAPTAVETELACKVSEIMPSIEQIRMVNSGTEATMSAIRLARGFTGRDKFVKFEGCYHGHSDALLVKAGSGALTLGVPNSPGVPASVVEHTLTLPYNDIDAARELFKNMGDEIACIIVEPVAGNMNCIPPVAGFLQGLREICDEHGSVLIFDEVMCGFRASLGGAQALFDVKPDLTTLGKVIGGGMPVGAFGGRKDIMQHLAPAGPVYQAGTLSGNPAAMSAGLVVMNELTQPGVYEQMVANTTKLLDGLKERAAAAGIGFTTNQAGTMFGLFFTDQKEVNNFEKVMKCDGERFKIFFHAMLDEGVYLAPSAFETGFMSLAHGDTEIQKTLDAAEKAFAQL